MSVPRALISLMRIGLSLVSPETTTPHKVALPTATRARSQTNEPQICQACPLILLIWRKKSGCW